ncbi:unnamed protein product [Toxocara canis]|uniref:Uncharacterized protein n=1 Tax=Toxocara canis TaxID=6265 RepID=A0A183VHN4_TOXCA|nr:unnamed protein product [Toxocara canis]
MTTATTVTLNASQLSHDVNNGARTNSIIPAIVHARMASCQQVCMHQWRDINDGARTKGMLFTIAPARMTRCQQWRTHQRLDINEGARTNGLMSITVRAPVA